MSANHWTIWLHNNQQWFANENDSYAQQCQLLEDWDLVIYLTYGLFLHNQTTF